MLEAEDMVHREAIFLIELPERIRLLLQLIQLEVVQVNMYLFL